MHASREIDLSLLDAPLRDAVVETARLARAAGGRALLVGGAVRDLAAGARQVKDADVEVFGLEPEKLKSAIGAKFGFDPCGESFGVLKLRHLAVDVSLPRRETKRGSGHRGFMVDSDPSLSVKEAAARRDFTVNAMYFDPLTGMFEDPWNGMRDLQNGILRHVTEKFAEDPLRVLRGMQFVARFDLKPAPETTALCRTMDIEGLPPERLFEEWSKFLLKGVEMSKGLEFLRSTGWLRHFPELAALVDCPQEPSWHPEGSVWNHTLLCLDYFAAHRTGVQYEDLVTGLAVLCHDFGKPAATFRDPKDGRIRSPGHDEAGVAPALSFLRRLTNEERILRDVPPLVQCHMQPFAMWKAKAKDAAVRRLAARAGRIDRLVRVSRADSCGRGAGCKGIDEDCKELDWLEAAAERLRVADSAPKPLLMGRHLIEAGMTPSGEFGRILSAAYEAQLDGAFRDLPGALSWFGAFTRRKAH